jgi:hypothetical protein
LILLTSARPALAGCDSCNGEISGIQKASKNLKVFEDLKRRNEEFLKSPAAQDASKAIKVKSNILICMVKIDTEKNNIFGLKQELNKKACTTCSGIPTDLPQDPPPAPKGATSEGTGPST